MFWVGNQNPLEWNLMDAEDTPLLPTPQSAPDLTTAQTEAWPSIPTRHLIHLTLETRFRPARPCCITPQFVTKALLSSRVCLMHSFSETSRPPGVTLTLHFEQVTALISPSRPHGQNRKHLLVDTHEDVLLAAAGEVPVLG